MDHTLEGNPSFSVPVFSPDGRWIASGCWDPTVTKPMFASVWDTHTGVLVTNFPTTKCTVLFSPDSRWLLLGASAEYRLFETDTWKFLRAFPRHGDMVEYGQAAFSSDGQLLALHATDRILRLVNPSSGAELARLNSPDRRILKALRFSADNRWLAAATEANIQVWDIPALRQSLEELGLDWGANVEGALSSAQTRREAASTLRHSSRWYWMVITPILLAMAVAIGLALSLRRHQAAMMAGYLGVNAMIAARDEQLARAQSELLHTQKMRALGTLAAGIAHDFNNLLSIIRLSNQLTARAAKANADVQENAADIEKAVVQGKNVVRSMLGYSRETADEGQPYSLAELVESIVGLLGKQFLSGITLTLELEPDLPPVTVSKARVEQILLNLIVNASEAMAGQGNLLLSARQAARVNGSLVLQPRPAPGYLEVLVADSGPGIAPETLPRIFEPFFTTKNIGATRGTGLGLSMVFTVAQQDGLGLDVKTAPGQGAAFRLLLPVPSPPADSPTTSPA
jgi:signal transduction histidine kinase